MRMAIRAWWSTLSFGWRTFMWAIGAIYVVGIPLSIVFERYDMATFLVMLCIATFGSLLYLIRSTYATR
jgi:hypothetical protein